MAVIHPVDDAGQYLLSGNVYARHQLQRALHCAHSAVHPQEGAKPQ